MTAEELEKELNRIHDSDWDRYTSKGASIMWDDSGCAFGTNHFWSEQAKKRFEEAIRREPKSLKRAWPTKRFIRTDWQVLRERTPLYEGLFEKIKNHAKIPLTFSNRIDILWLERKPIDDRRAIR